MYINPFQSYTQPNYVPRIINQLAYLPQNLSYQITELTQAIYQVAHKTAEMKNQNYSLDNRVNIPEALETPIIQERQMNLAYTPSSLKLADIYTANHDNHTTNPIHPISVYAQMDMQIIQEDSITNNILAL